MIEAAVVDASVAIKWVVAEPGEEQAAGLADATLSAPDILIVECGNALWAKARRREIGESDAIEAFATLQSTPLVLTPAPSLAADALRLALLLSHPIYDCLYLALALRTDTCLVTADRRCGLAARRLPELKAQVVLLSDLKH